MKSNITAKKLFFFIWPFGSLVHSILTFNNKSSRTLIVWFFGFLGFTLVTTSEGFDIVSLRNSFIASSNLSYAGFWEFIKGYLYGEQTVDIVFQSISFFVSRFTTDYRIFFMILAVILGFFYVSSVYLVHKSIIRRRTLGVQIVFIFFLFVVPPYEINRFRFFSAALVYFYFIYDFIVNNNKQTGIFFKLLLAPLMHFSFLGPYILYLLYRLIGNKPLLFLILFLLTFVYSNIVFEFLPNISAIVGDAFQARLKIYTSEITLVQFSERIADQSWYKKYYLILPFYSLSLVLIYIYHTWLKTTRKKSQTITGLISFFFLVGSYVNLLQPLPEGWRFLNLYFLFGLATVIKAFTAEDLRFSRNKISILTIILFVPFLLFCLVKIRMSMDFIDSKVFFLNPVTVFFLDDPIPIIDLFK